MRVSRHRSVRVIQKYLDGEKFIEWLPIMQLPSIQEVFRVFLGKSGVSKHQFGARALFREIKPNNGENSGIPVGYPPGLNDAFVRNEFEMASNDASTKQ